MPTTRKKTVDAEVRIRRWWWKPRRRCATCWRSRARTGGAPWSRSPWPRRCRRPCSATRWTKSSSATAALPCIAYAGASGHSGPRCGGTRSSTRVSVPRRKWRETWRRATTVTGTLASSAGGCNRASSAVVGGWEGRSCKLQSRKVVILQQVTCQID